jgi:hypothetical protein
VIRRLALSLVALLTVASGFAPSSVALAAGSATTRTTPVAASPHAYDAASNTLESTFAAGNANADALESASTSHDSSMGHLSALQPAFVAAETADVVVPKAWNAATKLPSGGTVRDVGSQIWGNGLPSATRLSGMTDAELRGLASLDDAKMLNAMYRGAQASVPNNATAPIRVQLSQQVIDAWGRK